MLIKVRLAVSSTRDLTCKIFGDPCVSYTLDTFHVTVLKHLKQ